jgi:hypothetical protein
MKNGFILHTKIAPYSLLELESIIVSVIVKNITLKYLSVYIYIKCKYTNFI